MSDLGLEAFRLPQSGQLRNLVFFDVKPFQIERFVNKQNDLVYSPKRSVENLHQNLSTADGNGVGRRNGRWSLAACIHRQ